MPEDDDEAARRATRGRTERATFPGIPTRHLPPRPAPDVPLGAPELDSTPPEPIVVRQRARGEQQTRVGVAPPSAGSAPMPPIPELVIEPRRAPVGGHPVASTPLSGPPQGDRRATAPQPPRSLSPSPESGGVQVTTPIGKFSLRAAVVRHVWLWGAPLALSALGFIGGYVKGYLMGLVAGHDELVRVQQAQRHDHDAITQLRVDVDANAAAAAQEAQSNRAERATALARWRTLSDDLEAVKATMPKIHGLPPPPKN